MEGLELLLLLVLFTGISTIERGFSTVRVFAGFIVDDDALPR